MDIIKWLLDGDVSVQYQVHRDLLDTNRDDLKSRIETEGFGKRFLDAQLENFHWGRDFYQVKWVSTHYTLLDLKHLNVNVTSGIEKAIMLILRDRIGVDGGINPARTIPGSDVCINGMCLNYMCYFNTEEDKLKSVIDFIITQQMSDRGFNCENNNNGAKHSSLHSTISVLEGIRAYETYGYTYRLDELLKIEEEAIEFILEHRLFKSDKTGEVIKKSFTMLSYPSRWKYDILRCLDYLRDKKWPYDSRIDDALSVIIKKRKKDGTWPVQAKHSGKVHFDMEKAGTSSRWNTLRALRVLNFYKVDH